jgi:cobalt/nickel transport system permease protein
LFAGIPALFIERDAALFIGGLEISTGLLSFVTVIFKAYLCVMAVLLLVATTPLIDMGIRLRRLGVPDILIMLFEMTYRYIGVLVEEASSMFRAYSLRSGGGRGIEMRHMGSFMGQLVLRSFDRAERVYAAMRCRGYGEKLNGGTGKWGKDLKAVDVIFLATVCAFCGFFRVFPY